MHEGGRSKSKQTERLDQPQCFHFDYEKTGVYIKSEWFIEFHGLIDEKINTTKGGADGMSGPKQIETFNLKYLFHD